MSTKKRVGVVGFTGYSGAELVQLLKRHSLATPVLLEHRSQAADEAPFAYGGVERQPFSLERLRDSGLDLVFFATPAEVSLDLVPCALEAGVKAVDLSGAFRLRTAANYQRWYGAEHTRPDLLAEAVYGLPEYYRATTQGARLVANPGCYPTAANLALRPLIAADVLDRRAGIVCDAKSGVSGAGKNPSPKTHFSSVTENLSAYSILNHRHVPEVLLTSGLDEREFSFTAQLLPVHRGILETIYVRTARSLTREELADIYRKAYAGEPFIRLYPSGRFPNLLSVAHTNYCDIGIQYDADTGRGVIVAAIDNLVKGAAGQAVQNMNLMLDFPETEGLW